MANAVSGFAKARINPYHEADSDDEEFLAADVSDMPLPQVVATEATTSSCNEGTAAVNVIEVHAPLPQPAADSTNAMG